MEDMPERHDSHLTYVNNRHFFDQHKNRCGMIACL